MFRKVGLNYSFNPFQFLSESVIFEEICSGRKAANLTHYDNNLIPIVRTTTSYTNPVQKFRAPHYELIDKIKNASEIPDLELNNAMIEIYSPTYRNMGFHSDQVLDLADNSYICIFSCYEDPQGETRKLKIRNKESNTYSEISLDHNTVIIFSINTNQKHVHKIILDKPKTANNRWLGFTFRMSRTLIKFENNTPYFYPDKKELRLANDQERKEFLKHKSLENSKIDYSYPEIYFTLSIGDMIPIR